MRRLSECSPFFLPALSLLCFFQALLVSKSFFLFAFSLYLTTLCSFT